MVNVAFSASGYGSGVTRYRTRAKAVAAVEREAHGLAGDRGLDPAEAVSRFGEEWVLASASGEEIARWELFE